MHSYSIEYGAQSHRPKGHFNGGWDPRTTSSGLFGSYSLHKARINSLLSTQCFTMYILEHLGY